MRRELGVMLIVLGPALLADFGVLLIIRPGPLVRGDGMLLWTIKPGPEGRGVFGTLGIVVFGPVYPTFSTF